MSSRLVLHEIDGSPNNVRVRLALRVKGLAFESQPFQPGGFPGDRSRLIELSGQPFTPVLVHGDVVMFDSWSILRYLEANFRDTPPLYSPDYATMSAIEGWELWARTTLGEPVGAVFQQALAQNPDTEACRAAGERMTALLAKVEDQLGTTSFLARETVSAADLACAPLVQLALIPPDPPKVGPIATCFQRHFSLGPGRDRTRAWMAKVMALAAPGK